MSSKISNLITKILLGLLLIFMIAGVAVWGINDILVGNRNKTVARVGNSKITQYELENMVQNSKRQLMQRGLTNLSDEFNTVIRNNVLMNLVGDRLLQNELAHLNLQIDGKEVLKKDYLTQPDFKKENFESFIKSQGGEDVFLSSIVKEKKIDIVQGSLTAISPVSERSVRAVFDFENQTRKIDYVELEPSVVTDIEDPTEAELNAFYEENKDNFLTPEYRSASYITIDSNGFKPSEGEDIVERLHTISGEVLDKISGGGTLEEVAKEYGLGISKIESTDSTGLNSNSVRVDNLPKVDNFVSAIFATEQGEISDLLESADGKVYSFIRVDSITEKRIKTLQEVKSKVSEAVKLKKKVNKLIELSKNLENELDTGKTSLQQFASAHNIQVKQANIRADSKEFSPEFVASVMKVKKGGYSNISSNKKGGILIAKITDISSAEAPSELKLFEYRSKLQDQVSQEIMAQYLDYLKNKYNVTIY